jgi:hypothetical protein
MSITVLPSNPAEVPLQRAFVNPPEALNAGHIDYATYGNNAELKFAADVLGEGMNLGNSLNEFRANQSDYDKAAVHDKKVRDKIEAEQRNFGPKLERAQSRLTAELKRVEGDLEAKAGLKSNPLHFDAITAAFHGMKLEQRVATINQLIEQRDGASLAHLVEAPLFLTGLTAEQRDSIKTRLYDKVDPQGLKLRDYLKVALDKVSDGMNGSIRMFAELRAGTEEGAWKVRAQQAAVHAARESQLKR